MRSTPRRSLPGLVAALALWALAGPTPTPAATIYEDARTSFVRSAEPERIVWSFRVGADRMVIEQARGGSEPTEIRVNGRFVDRFDGPLFEQPEATRTRVESAIAAQLEDGAGFSRGMWSLAQKLQEDLERLGGGPEEHALPPGLICLGVCWDCHGAEISTAMTAGAAASACVAETATAFTTGLCVGGALATIYQAIEAVPACLPCGRCWCKYSRCPEWLMRRIEELEDILTPPGTGSGNTGTSPSCPPGTHDGPTTVCNGSVPCCCDDWEPQICQSY